MMKGAIGFSRQKKNWLSKVIRWFTRSQWSHTFIIYQVEPEILVAEAGTFEVKIVPITKYESRKYATTFFFPDHLPVTDIEIGIKRARADLEKPYGYLQILGFIPVVIAKRLLGLKIKNPMRGGMVCSELVLEYLRGADPMGRWMTLQKDSVSPEDIFEHLAAHTSFRRMDST